MKIIRAFMMLLSASILFAQTPANIVKVTVDGYSYMGEGETIKVAKERAVKDAERKAVEEGAGHFFRQVHQAPNCERKAVEEGAGLYLESYSKVHNYMLVDDEVKSLVSGYITSKKVLVDELEANPPRYHVRIEAEVKCGDIDQMLADKKAEEQPPASTATLSVEFAVVAERKLADGSWGEILIKDGGELKSFDKFQVLMRPSSDCYLYLLLFDSQGKASVLFPSVETGNDNLVKKDTEVRAPGANLSYELDTEAGIETLYMIASAQPVPRLNWLLEKMEKAGNEMSQATLTRAIRTRGISCITQGKKTSFSLSDGKRIEKVTEVIQGRGAVVRKLSFNHLP